MSQYGKLVDIIARPPEERSEFEIGAILPYFLKRTKAFQRIQRIDLLKDLIRNCKFGSKQRDDIIIKQGEVGECFYVLLSGQVSVYIHNQDKGEEEEKQELQSIVQYKDGKLDRSKLGLCVVALDEGNSVGEVALIEEHKPIRTATVVVDEKTDLMIVDKPLYDRSVKSILQQEFQDKRQFINSNALFRTWTPKYCKQLTMALYKKTFPYDSVLVKQGDEVEFVYFILRGQVEIQIDQSTHPTQYAKIFRAARENEAEKLIRKADKTRTNNDNMPSNHNNNIRKRDNFKSTRLCYLGINESVGDTEMTMDLDTYMQTAVCKEHTEVLVLERKHYERLFVRRHPRTIDAMRQQIGVKLRTRKSLLSSKDDIPFLGYLAQMIDLKNSPPPTQEKERVEFSVSEAEKEFLNHKGPLIDQHGPGSVFYLIKVREQTKMKLRSKRERLVERPQAMKNLPSNVIAAAQQLINGSHELGERAHSARVRENRVHAQPRSFRRIQSAHQEEGDDVDEEEEEEVEEAREAAHREAAQRERAAAADREDEEEGSSDLSVGWQSPRLQHVQGGSEVSENPEQHDARLSFLEEKIRDWLRKDNPRVGPQVAQLRRLTAQDMEQQPRPGNKVVIRRRRRVSSANIMDENPRPKKEDSRTEPFKILLTNS